eukprot:scaffold70644_cov55-Phaeocystis_antarctica.AAC.1
MLSGVGGSEYRQNPTAVPVAPPASAGGGTGTGERCGGRDYAYNSGSIRCDGEVKAGLRRRREGGSSRAAARRRCRRRAQGRGGGTWAGRMSGAGPAPPQRAVS